MFLKTPIRRAVLVVNVPQPQEPRPRGRRETIIYAIDSNPRTFRLCLILVAAAAPSGLVAAIVELLRHMH
jgi:hypothetical protein